jgi:DNA-binding NtrC family response regulator
MKSIQAVKQRFGIVGRSASLDQALGTAIRVASTDLTVLITGESGVGKEVFSKIIHSLSPRKHNNFIAVNCGAIPEGTINSELFGHEKGAFTGASSERKGYFETVDGGTIFLDEIGEMPPDTQSFLLRILESGEFIRVGSSVVQKTDVRVIAATNRPLEDKLQKGKFRDDLYYRLNTVPIYVPALHERKEDISILLRKFASDFAERYRSEPIRFDNESLAVLENYRWKGNVRELKNAVEQLSVLSEEKFITPETLHQFMPHVFTRNLPALKNGDGDSLNERELLYKVLFDMRKDLSDLKTLIWELIQKNDLELPAGGVNALTTPQLSHGSSHYPGKGEDYEKSGGAISSDKPIILDRPSRYDSMEIVEESLSLEDMEKQLIRKALKKHKGRRKDAAEELGISERTLYRKIKQYEL